MFGNGNGKQWELIAREWEWECKKPFTGISNLKDYMRPVFSFDERSSFAFCVV